MFTCLSFYHGALNIAQVRQNYILKSDDPSIEYDRWVQSSASFPGSLREWKAINLEDELQVREISRHLRYSVAVIDFFLNHFVFPQHAKQFQVKICASGWDIVHFARSEGSAAEKDVAKHSMTTGFSGTNDNKPMLPLLIEQDDLPTLSHTNAEVLGYLLQPRNRRCELAADFITGRRLTEDELLRTLNRNGIRILIDAGAQILEMDNSSLAKRWLKMDNQATAAIYFDDGNKPWVLYRQGVKIPLIATPFAEDAEGCLVYLDEAHTRGIDLKLPINARGALTLGLGAMILVHSCAF